MNLQRLLGAAAAAALLAGAAQAQTAPVEPTPPTAPTVKTDPVPPAQPTPTLPGQPPVSAGTPATPASAAASPAAPAIAAPAAKPVMAQGDIVETLKADGRFTTLVKALDATNMTGVLKKNTNLTLFAPTDAAFAALPAGELDKLMKDPAALQKLLTYHLVNATVDSTKIKGAKGGVQTVAGQQVMLDGSGEAMTANTATIIQADVKPSNGTIHVVDRVLSPSAVTATATAAATTTDTASTDASTTAPAATRPDTPTEPEAPTTPTEPPKP